MSYNLYKYKGKEPCAGCGRTGAEAPREDKNSLCPECKKLLKLGKEAKKVSDSVHYTALTVQWYYLMRDDLNGPMFEFLKEIDTPNADSLGATHIRTEGVTASSIFKIPTLLVEPLAKMIKAYREVGKKLYSYEEELKKENEKILNKERDKIFNEGVQRGRNLLFQLNRGEITADELNNNITKYGDK